MPARPLRSSNHARSPLREISGGGTGRWRCQNSSSTVHLTLPQLAELVGGTLLKDAGSTTPLTGFASCEDAGASDLTFYSSDKYLQVFLNSAAGAALVNHDFDPATAPQIAGLVGVDDPSAAFNTVVQKFGARPPAFLPGIHPSAVVDPSAELAAGQVSVGANSVIGAGSVVGAGTAIGAGTVIGEGVVVGERCLIHPNVTILDRCLIGNRVILHSGCVIGSDGFGFALVDGRYQKIDQVGIVQIDDDVEIGANSTIDRARFGRTWIQEGAKIDNLVQVAHNCVIGRHTALAAQVGISGSTHIGNHCMLAGQAGVAGHLRIADQVVILGDAGVTKDIESPGQYLGYPAEPHMQALRRQALERRLPKLFERVKALEKSRDGAGPDA
ncbi:UDP-3-O-(3-hydroxymyristoyl)glucosamine N-acyltransferase [soil metagenome]